MPYRARSQIAGLVGRELTEQLLARRDRVTASLRHPEQLDELAARYGDRLRVRALDVTDTGQLRRVLRAHGGARVRAWGGRRVMLSYAWGVVG